MLNIVDTIGVKDIIGKSKQTKLLKENILKISNSYSTVLITGESGTGKEMVATSIWKASNRKKETFVPVNCAAIPEPLLESELFGYVKGAFTGADPKGKIGKFEIANNGVIFLDEIGDMPLHLQAKLLRVLQEKKITRVGSNNQIDINVRVLAATNKDLQVLIDEKKFREDLFYRLNVIPIQIEPLRERIEDIDELIYLFIDRYVTLFGKYFTKINKEVIEALKLYNWPGNVRELENSVEFMINMMNEDGVLDSKTLPNQIINYNDTTLATPKSTASKSVLRTLKDLEETVKHENISRVQPVTQKITFCYESYFLCSSLY